MHYYKCYLVLALFVFIIIPFSGFAMVLLKQPDISAVLFQDFKTDTNSDSIAIIEQQSLVLYKKNVKASYYADQFNGRKTASGKKFDNTKYTAAHKTLPFGTKLKVTNQSNHTSVIVEVNDRGPFISGREIDLSKRAFFDIAKNKSQGVLKVTLEIIE